VLLEIEKINNKKQEREYKKYLDRQIKEFRDQRTKQKLKEELEKRKVELGLTPSVLQGRIRKVNPRSESKKRWQ